MDNAQKYIKLYLEESQKCFKKWGYYYPPRDRNEFESCNREIFEEHLNDFKTEVIKTELHIGLLDATDEFGFYEAFRNNDNEILNNVLYQVTRQRLLDSGMTASGTDHSNVLMTAASAFACNDFEIINHFFPKELPHSKGIYYTEVATNLLKVLYYKEDELHDGAIEKADKFLSKKITTWDKYVVSYFLSLINRDVTQADFCLQELCTAYQKMGYPKSNLDKCFASEIHGMYRFARIIDEAFFNKISRPKHACFFEAFELWQEEHQYPKGRMFYIYPQEMDYMNKIFEAQLPVMSLIGAKSPKGREHYKDVEQFAADLTENVKHIL
ncbi:hypothetical protein [Pedobacter caeni]|uniref:Immunity protein 49 n=1 Tax=Pedobacter caeni TaxID=288992 RepID=A0A1M4UCN7_9SPHI|nr:hypothetical protein [Pedobacter caeni]SHE54509.1 hypothetical protein SAMN04488522_101510 [Pedobacter caeni]